VIDGPTAPSDLRLLEAFLNSVDERTFRRHGAAHAGGDRLTSPAALSDWLAEQAVPVPEARSGADLSDARPTEADLAAAVRLRTTLRQLLLADASQRGSVLEGFSLHLVVDPEGTLRLAATGESPLNPIVETVTAAVVQGTWARLKICAAPDCRWVFYDASRSGAGRWCSMEVCGNRTKTRLYRQRHRAS
jgi:predicted RNA-binding Zn ribbon-like protein